MSDTSVRIDAPMKDRYDEVLTADALTETYGIRIEVVRDEHTGRVHTRPVGKHTHRSHLTTV